MTKLGLRALLLASVIAYGVSYGAGSAQAGIEACGDIDVEAEAQCEVIPPGVQCEGMCTPLTFEAACTAELSIECRGMCTDLPSVQCQGECSGGCEASCSDFEPGQFDCQASCQADCAGRCEASCSASQDGSSCMARCEGSCSASCDASCDVELPSADCSASCEASCEGSCEADANFDCQVDCQADGFAQCEAELMGGCMLACDAQEGALFCDGQYVDHGDNLKRCVDALRAALDIEVEGYAEGDASCDGNACMASGEAGVSCVAASPGPARGVGGGPALLLLALGGLIRLRRRR